MEPTKANAALLREWTSVMDAITGLYGAWFLLHSERYMLIGNKLIRWI